MFGVRSNVHFHDNLLVGVMSGTALLVDCLPMPVFHVPKPSAVSKSAVQYSLLISTPHSTQTDYPQGARFLGGHTLPSHSKCPPSCGDCVEPVCGAHVQARWTC